MASENRMCPSDGRAAMFLEDPFQGIGDAVVAPSLKGSCRFNTITIP